MFKASLVAGVCLIVFNLNPMAHALPTLYFYGNLNYSSDRGILELKDVQLKDTLDIELGIGLDQIYLNLELALSNVVEETIPGTPFAITTAYFGSSSTGSDLLITQGQNPNPPVLLAGEMQDISMRGLNTLDQATFNGQILPTGGNLEDIFKPEADFFSLVANLDFPYAPEMFDNDFQGTIDGSIVATSQPVPEPKTLLLVSLGLAGLFWFRRKE